MASLIQSLAISGARDASGNVVAGGRVFLTQPGSANTAVTAYTDADKSAAVSLNGGGYILDGGGRVQLFVEDPCTVRVEDSAGQTQGTWTEGGQTNAGLVEVTTPGWTGLNSGGSATSGSQTYLDTVLSSIYASVGGLDGKFRGTYGINDTNIKDEIERLALTPQRFGARGDGVTDDTTAFLNLAAAASASGIEVFIPKGTYKITQAITWAAATLLSGVSRSAASASGSTIMCANATQDGFIFGLNCTASNFSMLTSSGSTGTGIKMASGRITGVRVDSTGGGAWTNALNSNGSATVVFDTGALTGSTAATLGLVLLIFPLSTSGALSTQTMTSAVVDPNTRTTSMANGGSVTPSVSGQAQSVIFQRVVGTSAGGGTINVPSGVPVTHALLLVECLNSSGGAFLFTFAAGMKSTGTANPGNGLKIVVQFAWDASDSIWVECGRTSTAGGI